MKQFFILSLSALISSVVSQAQAPYFLDPNFGSGGVEVVRNNEWTPQFGPYVTYKVRNMIVGADDKIWLSGNVAAIYSVEGVSTDHALTRLLPNGKPDPSFNGTGHLNFGATNQPDVKWMDNMVLLPDNKLLYAGNSTQSNTSRTVIYKVNNNGTLDNTFGAGGVVRHSGPLPFNDLKTLDVQSTGKIIALTASFNNTTSTGVILRLNSNGSINTFGTSGIMQPAIGFPDTKIDFGMIKILPDNSFLVVGTHVADAASGAPPYSAHQDFIAKFSADGVLQTSFGTNGKTILPKGSNDRLSFFNKYIDVDINGNIYVNCSVQDLAPISGTFPVEVTVYKLNANGALVSSYGQNGRLGIPGTYAGSFHFYDAQVQNGDQLLVASMTDTGMNANYLVKRLNADGSDDLTFTGNSAIITGTRNALDHFHFLGLQSDNKIIVGGWRSKKKTTGSDTLHPVIMRIVDHETGTVDTGTSVVSIKDQQQIKVFPNPMGNHLYIRGLKSNTQVMIFDISGKAILHTTVSATVPEPVDCSQLAAGIYWLQLKEERSAIIYTQKLIKQ